MSPIGLDGKGLAQVRYAGFAHGVRPAAVHIYELAVQEPDSDALAIVYLDHDGALALLGQLVLAFSAPLRLPPNV
jgi:hypothetical protein